MEIHDLIYIQNSSLVEVVVLRWFFFIVFFFFFKPMGVIPEIISVFLCKDDNPLSLHLLLL